MKKYNIYKMKVEIPEKQIEEFKKVGMKYLDQKEIYDSEPKLHNTFETLEAAQTYLNKCCRTTLSNVMGNSANRYRELEYYELWIDSYDYGVDEDDIEIYDSETYDRTELKI